MKPYDHKKIEKKWQKTWADEKVYKTLDAKSAKAKGKKPYYVLDMFPYPSGAGLHVGHPRGYIASDVFARMKRMQGFNVLHPMGYDAFGLPAEQYAVQHKIHPEKAVKINIATFRKQLQNIGFSYDWTREVNTTDPEYYRWTQWIFLQIYNSWYDKTKQKARPITELEKELAKNGNQKIDAVCDENTPIFSKTDWKNFSDLEKQNILMKYRLAYEGYAEVNWCAEMGTVLANDEVIEKDGKMVSERGEFPVVKKQMRQWFMRITAYADRLLTGLETLDWSHSIKEIKRNWIGKSEGSEISFSIKNSDAKITVFTTRADTLFGVTYVVLAPEHELILQLAEQIKNWDEVEQYITSVKSKSDEDRVAAKEKTGIQLQGIFAINPANNEEVPVWIADYVLAGYGTGAVMAVPAHDERDFEFAKKYELPVNQVIEPQNISWPSILKTDNEIKEYVTSHRKKLEKGLLCYTEDNDGDELINSGSFSGMFLEESRKAITEFVDGKLVTKYKMRDAIFARQRYWGEPIPLVHEELPLKVFFLKESLQKGYDKELSKLSVSKSLHEDWGVNYFVKSDKLDQFIKTAQKLLLDKKGDIWYFDVSGRKQLVCYKKKVFEVTDPIQNELAKEHGRQGGIPEEQLDWKVQEKLDNNLIQTVPEKQLPLKLPNVKSYEPSGNGEGPLATVKSWVTAGYETNTMPGWAGSSWYFLRYTDPKNKKALASETELDYWFGKNGGVNMYVGGAEHATGHLLYSRFWHKVLKDLGHVKTEEPFAALRNQGMIGGADGRKMSKRWGNVINPDDVVADMGADTLRVYESFMGPFDAHLPWSIDGIAGARRFVERIWRFQTKVSDIAKTTEHLEKVLHKTIKKVSEDIQNFAFNTAVSAMMIFANELEKAESINTVDFKKFLQILAPFAPHITDELWVSLGEKQSIHIAPWPKFDPKKIIDNTVTIGIQINGKVRGEIEINIDESEDKIKSAVLAMPEIIKWMDGKEIKKFIYIKGRIINIVIG